MGLIFDIKRYSINDGPGIRTTIFLKGCPLSCVWCHNPEGISHLPQLLYTRKRCIGCGICLHICPSGAISPSTNSKISLDTTICNLGKSGDDFCGKCAKECPAAALEISGSEYSVEEVMAEIEKERIFMEESGGGVTFCGGEPLMQYRFLFSLLKKCRRIKIHTAIDTSLYAYPAALREIAMLCELFLVDLKIMNREKHIRFCGVSNDLIFNNLKLLSDLGREVIIRIPLIEGVNCDEANLEAVVALLRPLENIRKIELLPYHDIGIGKHDKLRTLYNPDKLYFGAVSDDKIKSIAAYLNSSFSNKLVID